MVYSTICWGESTQNNGLAGVAGLANQNHNASGDKLKLKTTPSPPYLMGFGSVSDTKPQGSALVPDTGNGNKPIYGPGAIDFVTEGWAWWMRSAPVVLQKGDQLTGQASNTNVAEGTVVAADIQYGSYAQPWNLAEMRQKYIQIISQQVTITSGAAVTFNSGSTAIETAATEKSNWLDVDASYEILGTSPCISAATFGGICNVTGLGGNWKGEQPGLLVSPLSAVTFSPGGSFAPALEPIPFDGDSPPDVGMTATSAGAVKFNIVMGQIGGAP